MNLPLTWRKKWTKADTALDTGTLDLGYHYDPVDIIIEPAPVGNNDTSISVTGSLTVMPGVVIGFSDKRSTETLLDDWMNGLYVKPGGYLDMRGTGAKPIRLVSTLAAGDKIGTTYSIALVPYQWNLWYAVTVMSGALALTEYCTFENIYCGLVREDMFPWVQGCRFSGCWVGVMQAAACTQPLQVVNCLFRDIHNWGAVSMASATHSSMTVVNCTFHRCQTGTSFSVGASGNAVRNCIYHENETGIFKTGSPTFSESYNCFYKTGRPTNFTSSTTDLTADPKFVNTTAPDLYARFFLDQTNSPCIDTGGLTDTCFLSTSLDKRLDTQRVDRGYHWPWRGLLKVGPNRFFEFDNGETTYPIAASNPPMCFDEQTGQTELYGTTVPLYLAKISAHGINLMRRYAFLGWWGATQSTTFGLQHKQYNAQTGEGEFSSEAVEDYDKFFNALDAKGMLYEIVAHDSVPRWIHEVWQVFDPGPPPHWDWDSATTGTSLYTPCGSVPYYTSGTFFVQDTPSGYNAKGSFKHTIEQFLDRGSPAWHTRKGLLGFDVFASIDIGAHTSKWGDIGGTNYDTNWWLRDYKVTDWAMEMMNHLTSEQTTSPSLGPGQRHLQRVSAFALSRFSHWDYDTSPPEYMSIPHNDFVDYHLFTSHTATVKPQDAFTPVAIYLGLQGHESVASSSSTLPKVIDHYRKKTYNKRGFFSSEFALWGWDAANVSKRLVNDCYHNYLWMGMATGSIGGPTPWIPAGATAPEASFVPGCVRSAYDVSGQYYHTSYIHGQTPMNAYTDEILDSMQAMSRFASLVYWKGVDASYRPLLAAGPLIGTSVTVRNGQYGTPLATSAWLWTAASDRKYTVGWILRNVDRDYEVPEYQDPVTTTTPPWLHISGLNNAQELELCWFDDRRGILIGPRTTSTSGSFNVQLPNTEPGGFGRSVAFLIQPVGVTPHTSFEGLPNEKDMICQIVADPWTTGTYWLDEHPTVPNGTELTFTARAKPVIDDSNKNNYTFRWDFGDGATAGPTLGAYQVNHTYDTTDTVITRKVTVEIKNYSPEYRLSGDILYVVTKP